MSCICITNRVFSVFYYAYVRKKDFQLDVGLLLNLLIIEGVICSADNNDDDDYFSRLLISPIDLYPI